MERWFGPVTDNSSRTGVLSSVKRHEAYRPTVMEASFHQASKAE